MLRMVALPAALIEISWVAVQPGDKFGKYAILAGIGKGGMGEVFRAHDSSVVS